MSRIRQAVLGKRAGTLSSVARNVDTTATYGHEHPDANPLEDRDPDGKERS